MFVLIQQSGFGGYAARGLLDPG